MLFLLLLLRRKKKKKKKKNVCCPVFIFELDEIGLCGVRISNYVCIDRRGIGEEEEEEAEKYLRGVRDNDDLSLFVLFQLMRRTQSEPSLLRVCVNPTLR